MERDFKLPLLISNDPPKSRCIRLGQVAAWLRRVLHCWDAEGRHQMEPRKCRINAHLRVYTKHNRAQPGGFTKHAAREDMADIVGRYKLKTCMYKFI